MGTVLIERIAGREHVLFERAGKYCHFSTDLVHDNHIIMLRVDWRDLWLGEPKLDADIYKKKSDGTKGRRLPNREWHHTKLVPRKPGDVSSYLFRFRDLELELIARKTLALTVSLSAYIVDGDESSL